MNKSDNDALRRITIRVPAHYSDLIDRLTDRRVDVLAPTITQLILRGIELLSQQTPAPKAKAKKKVVYAAKNHPWRKL